MLDLDRTMFFNTMFHIEDLSGADALHTLVTTMRTWALHKAKRDRYLLSCEDADWTQIERGGHMKSPSQNTFVHLYSVFHKDEGTRYWACQHVETVMVPDHAPRRWITEVGFSSNSLSSGTVSVVTMYNDRPGFYGPLQDEPTASTPYIIRLLFNNEDLACMLGGDRLSIDPVAFSEDDVPVVHELIVNPEREVPIVLIAPTHLGTTLLDPVQTAYQLGPTALVYHTASTEALRSLNGILEEYSLYCPYGAVRVYAPHPDITSPGDSYRHRYFNAHAIREHGGDYHLAILRRALGANVNACENATRVDGVKLKKRIAENNARLEESITDSVLEIAAESEGKLNNQLSDIKKKLAETGNEMLEKEIRLESLEKELHLEKVKAESLEAALGARSVSNDELKSLLGCFSELSREVIARIFVQAYPDRIDFSERGWNSLADSPIDPPAFWYALHCMCTALYPLYERNEGNPQKKFGDQTRLTLKQKETAATMRVPEWARERDDVYEGRPISIEAHVASGAGDPENPKFVRIYFAWDAETGRLVIGDTHHLTNRTTGKLNVGR